MVKGSETSDVEKGSEISDAARVLKFQMWKRVLKFHDSLLNLPWPLINCALCLSLFLLLLNFRKESYALED